MEADSVDFEAWKGMEDISDDDIEQIYENDAENFFLRIQSFEQDLNEKLSNRGFRDGADVLAIFVRRLFPVFARSKNSSEDKMHRFLNMILSSIQRLHELVITCLENRNQGSQTFDAVKLNLMTVTFLIELIQETLAFATFGSMAFIDFIPKILRKSICHCQFCPNYYGHLLDRLNDELKSLFAQCKLALANFFAFVDAGKEEICWTDLPKFMREMDSLQRDLIDIEFHSFGIVCKVFIRICKAYPEMISKSQFDVLPHLLFVSHKTETSVENLKTFLASNDESGLKREATILIFLLKTFNQQLTLVEDKAGINQNLFSLFSTLATVDDISTTELNNSVPKLSTEVPTLIHNFIVQIASEPDFAHFVLNRFEPESEPVRGSAIFLAKILSLFGATQKENNEHLVKIWFLDADKHLFEILVRCIALSHADFCNPPLLPGVQYGGKPLTSYTTYEYILTRAQAFIAGLTPDLIEHVETTFLKFILQPKSFWSAQFCIDVWAFLARYGPPELCLNYVRLLMDVHKNLTSNDVLRDDIVFLESAIDRLFKFLCKEDMVNVKNLYSLSKDPQNLHIWKLIGGESLLKNKVPITDLQLISISYVDRLIMGNICPDIFPFVCSSLTLLLKHWTVLEPLQQDTVASKLASVWSMLDDMREKINIDSNWIVSLLDPLFLLTEKVYLSRKNNVSENVGHVINFATADSSLSFFLMDRTSCLLASCSQLICPDELTLHLFTLTKKLKNTQTVFLNATFLSLCKRFDVMAFNGYLVENKDDENINDYFEGLNTHSVMTCPSKLSPNTHRVIKTSPSRSSSPDPIGDASNDMMTTTTNDIRKKRKLIEAEKPFYDCRPNSLTAVATIRQDIECRNLSLEHRKICEEALDILEKFLGSEK